MKTVIAILLIMGIALGFYFMDVERALTTTSDQWISPPGPLDLHA